MTAEAGRKTPSSSSAYSWAGDATGGAGRPPWEIFLHGGSRDTKNSNDSVIAASAVNDYTLQTKQLDDGAMLAWKTIVLRSSTAAALCTAPAGSGGPGPR